MTSAGDWLRRITIVVTACLLAGAALGPIDAGGAAQEELPLGPPGLEEKRVATRLAPGVMHTVIERGHRSSDDFFTVDVVLLRARTRAEEVAHRLRKLGHEARVEVIAKAAPDDPRRGPIGYLVRVGRFSAEESAVRAAEDLVAAGFDDSAPTYTGFDGGLTTGPWVVNVLDIDLHRFTGEIVPELGTHVVPGLETLTSIAARTDALAAVNGGYFVIEPIDGTPGDLAGISVLGGQLISEAVNGRTSLLLREKIGTHASIAALRTRLSARVSGGRQWLVDGLNRKPGLIRSCGGVGGDVPTQRPKHDITCSDSGEVVVFTPAFGAQTEEGPGAEAVLDRDGRVIALREDRGSSIPPGGSVLAATGEEALQLQRRLQIGEHVVLRQRLRANGSGVRLTGLDVVNGGPGLLRGGRTRITAFGEGFVHLDDPFFYVAFGLRRNPRTIAGVTADGHLLLVTIDGRQPDWSVGASFIEEARVMRSLGALESVNLDGGGSTTLTIGEELANRPSDEEGERPIGDALLLLNR